MEVYTLEDFYNKYKDNEEERTYMFLLKKACDSMSDSWEIESPLNKALNSGDTRKLIADFLNRNIRERYIPVFDSMGEHIGDIDKTSRPVKCEISLEPKLQRAMLEKNFAIGSNGFTEDSIKEILRQYLELKEE